MIVTAPQLSLEELRDVALLAATQHYGRTAQALGISQPALTKRIAALEARLGGPLFLRGRTGVQATATGRLLAEKGQGLLAEAGALERAARGVLQGRQGTLRIGAGLSVMLAGLPELLLEFRRQHPQAEISVRDMGSRQLRMALDAGELDVAFLRLEELVKEAPAKREMNKRELNRQELDRKEINWAQPGKASQRPKVAVAGGARLVLTEELRLACPSRLATRLRRAPEELHRQPLLAVARAASPTLQEQVEEVCRQMGYQPPLIQEFNQVLMVLLMVQAGAGVAIVPGSAEKLRMPGITFLPQPLPGGRWEIGLATGRRGSNPLIEPFCALAPNFFA